MNHALPVFSQLKAIVKPTIIQQYFTGIFINMGSGKSMVHSIIGMFNVCNLFVFV